MGVSPFAQPGPCHPSMFSGHAIQHRREDALMRPSYEQLIGVLRLRGKRTSHYSQDDRAHKLLARRAPATGAAALLGRSVAMKNSKGDGQEEIGARGQEGLARQRGGVGGGRSGERSFVDLLMPDVEGHDDAEAADGEHMVVVLSPRARPEIATSTEFLALTGSRYSGSHFFRRKSAHIYGGALFAAPRLFSTSRISRWSKSATQPPCRTKAEPRERSWFAMPKRPAGPVPGHPQVGCRQEFRELFSYCSAK